MYAAESAWLAAVKAGTADRGKQIGLSGAAAAHDLAGAPVEHIAEGTRSLRVPRWDLLRLTR